MLYNTCIVIGGFGHARKHSLPLSKTARSQNSWGRNCFSFILCIVPFTLACALKLKDQVKICGHIIFFLTKRHKRAAKQ